MKQLKDYIRTRVLELAEYIIEQHATVRQAAKQFSVSKSTVHKDMRSRLQYIDQNRYEQVAVILQFNLSERHIRGGIATKEKYQKLRTKKELLH